MKRPALNLREALSFGFEQTFTTPEWWTEPGFVATSDTPLKRAKLLALAQALVKVQGGEYRESQDIYQHLQYETFFKDGSPSFVVTMDPGSIEVKTEPVRVDQVAAMMKPLFEAAELAGVVPYRNWWYGVRGGTEGGCHVNMGGFTRDTNPWYLDPILLLQYAGFQHNHPEIHFPFMGIDTGPGGNAIRMDEHEEPTRESMRRWRVMRTRMTRAGAPSPAEFADFFKGTKIADDRHSAPSFYKYKEPLFLVEDRAQESFRSAEDAELVCQLRLAVLERLQATAEIEDLVDFGPELHSEGLTLPSLWARFETLADRLALPALDYFRFFERQFPRLSAGVDVPNGIEVREGRRPRVIIGAQTRGALVISKTIDTRYKRVELHWPAEAGEEIRVNGMPFKGGMWREPVSQRSLRYVVLDLCVPPQQAILDLSLAGGERARFHLGDMMFKARPIERQHSKIEASNSNGVVWNLETVGSFYRQE